MPTASDIAISVGGTDVTAYVMFATARFESQLGAIPGSFEMTLKDVDQVLSFTTGDEVTLTLDGVLLWGGFALNVVRSFAFAAVDTTTPATVKSRIWRLSGLDYNVLFDKRVLHNAADHLTHLPFFTLDQTMGELIRDVLPDYLDLSGDGLDLATFVDDTFVPRFDADGNPDPNASAEGSWPQQGSYWRAAMDQFSQYGVVYYIDAAKNLHFHEVEETAAPWGFSDVPNKLALPNAAATYGMREYEDTTEGSAMANDAFVWGGSEWSGSSGGTVFARAQNASSITTHRRWQYAETRFGDLRGQGEVKARANVIVSGNTTGAVGGDTSRGLAVDQQQIRLAWFGHDVPSESGQKKHLRPSDVVTISMFVMGDGIDPLVRILPLRTLKISFPTLPSSGSSPADPKTYVRFDGFFGLQLSDPYWLWKYLRDLRGSTPVPPIPVATADDSTTVAVYGAFGRFTPSPAPDGVTTTFTLPFAYIDGTLRVYRNGVQYGITQVTESSPETGEFEMASAPAAATSWVATCRVAGGIN